MPPACVDAVVFMLGPGKSMLSLDPAIAEAQLEYVGVGGRGIGLVFLINVGVGSGDENPLRQHVLHAQVAGPVVAVVGILDAGHGPVTEHANSGGQVQSLCVVMVVLSARLVDLREASGAAREDRAA